MRFELASVPEVGGEVRHAFGRVVREATSNAVRHWEASTVTIRLQARNRMLHLVVTDDGKGFDPRVASESGFGLRSMRERVENLGGSFTIRSEPGHGADVQVSVPAPSVR